ncbi:helix-turn-helix domain-containing protein [Gordonia sp. ABSL49_1]|uniref:AlbA family DNA-binding domain-containing protein n=1 Tax=Gordonia sp. ABSL49_1 TaxID=2920941 RepID=UPI001F10EBF7|nr:ATP-binding protein [Gordonia sp. ABSL49_1]MCH5644227.1 ATP-binding protein [Gordonia sp. ABSL49_1]
MREHSLLNLADTTEIETAVPVWTAAIGILIVLAVALVFAGVARLVLRRHAHLELTTCIVLSMLGSTVGLMVAGLIDRHIRVLNPVTILLALAGSIVVVAIYGAVAARFQRQQHAPITDLLAQGESDRVEFKSTARINLRTGQKDPKMEHVIAKTIAAFVNADGGTLLVGVDDDGTPLGLDPDYATLKVPDADRFELWLRDLLTTTLGQNIAASVGISVEDVAVQDSLQPVCRITCVPSPQPVYLKPGKNAAPELWVRTGNSSRQLNVDAAADYVMHRWPLGAGSALAAQARAAVRFSVER